MTDRDNTQTKKQTYLQGAAILTIAALITKAIGGLFKIPLTTMITSEGAGHFYVAYNIYIVLLNVSSTGLPVAVSHLISRANTLEHRGEVMAIHRVSLRLFLLLGVLCSGAMLIFSPQLASWMRDPEAVYAIAVLAPAVFFVCVSSSFRGFFQGQQYMTPTAWAQVLEALCKLFLGLAAAYVALRMHLGYAIAAGAAILGVTVGAMISSGYLTVQYRKKRLRLSEEEAAEAVPTSREIVRRILKVAVPITIGATGLQIVNTLCSRIILGRLQDALSFTAAEASSQYGIYSMAQTLYLLPSALVQPLAVSIIPAVTAALALGNRKQARQMSESAIRVTGLVALPCGVGLAVLAGPIQRLLYRYDAETLAVAGPTLTILGIASIFYCLILVTNAILQANGKTSVPIVTTLIGGSVNILVDCFLVGRPEFHILGAALGNLSYCVVVLLLNLLALKRFVPEPPRMLPQIHKTVLASVIMGIGAWGTYRLLGNVLLAVAVAGLLYLGLVYCLRIITMYDCRLLPKGEWIARFLRVSGSAEDSNSQ